MTPAQRIGEQVAESLMQGLTAKHVTRDELLAAATLAASMAFAAPTEATNAPALRWPADFAGKHDGLEGLHSENPVNDRAHHDDNRPAPIRR